MDAGIPFASGVDHFPKNYYNAQINFGPGGQLVIPVTGVGGGGGDDSSVTELNGPASVASTTASQSLTPVAKTETFSATEYSVTLPPTTQMSPTGVTSLANLFTPTAQSPVTSSNSGVSQATSSNPAQATSSLVAQASSESFTTISASSTGSKTQIASSLSSATPSSSFSAPLHTPISSGAFSSDSSNRASTKTSTTTSRSASTISSPSSRSLSSTSALTSRFSSSSSSAASSIPSISAAQSTATSNIPSTSSTSTMPTYSSIGVLASAALASTISSSAISSQTSLPPIVPAEASTLNVHSTTFYLVIALGILATIACITALIAWCIRVRTRAKRRRVSDMVVPWARSDEEDGGMGLGVDHAPSQAAAFGAMNLGSREDLAHIQAWSPRGDRDVGEPRRAYPSASINRSMYSLRDHPIPGHGLFSEKSSVSSFDGRSTPPLRPKATLRQLPSHLIDEEMAARAQQEGRYSPFSRRPVGVDRGDSRHNPYLHQGSTVTQRSMAERLRNHGKPAEPEWDRLPTPGTELTKEEAEPWAASFKSSLVSAFNAVAAGLTPSAAVPHLKEEDDILTAPPTRQPRLTVRNVLSRSGSTTSSKSSASGKLRAWTLEEKGDGTGVVHFISPLDDLKRSDVSKRPSMPAHALSFGDGESISTYDERSDKYRPVSTLIRPDNHFGKGKTHETLGEGSISRNSSIYSTSSTRGAGSRVFRIPTMTRAARLSMNRATEEEDENDRVVIEPDIISRVSSSDSSAADGGLGRGHGAAAASDLMARHKNVTARDQDVIS